mgnify:CR=1 FL=1
MPRVGVVLSGCGVYDGAEIHESVLTMLALDRAGADMVLMAPDVEQMHVINHLTGQVVEGERRNVLVESARIARGNIKDIKDVKAGDIDALIFPGGYGAAKNLCNYATKGPDCAVHPEVARLVKDMYEARKPIGAICISPAVIAKVLGNKGPELTIGTDRTTAQDIEKMGAKHIECPVDDFRVDRDNKIVTTPAYMLANRISEAAVGIEKAVRAVLDLIP